MKKTRKSLLSVLLTLVMLVGLVPALATEAHAAAGDALPGDMRLYIGGERIYNESTDSSDPSARVSYSSEDKTVTVTLTDFNYSGSTGITLNSVIPGFFGSGDIYHLVVRLAGENWISARNAAIENITGGNITFELLSGWTELGLESGSYAVKVNGGATISLGNGLMAGKAHNNIYSAIDAIYNGNDSTEGVEAFKFNGTYVNTTTEYLADRYAIITVDQELEEAEMTEDNINNSPDDPKSFPDDLKDFKFSDYTDYTITERSGLNKLSFNVGLKNSDSYEGPRPSSTYRYIIASQSTKSPSPQVTFANGSSEYSLTFGENSGGMEELKTVMLNISEPVGVAAGLHVYRITQRYNVDQHNAGFDAKDDVQYGSYWDTDYYLFLNVNGGGKITQAILLPGDLDENVTNDKRDGFYIEYASSVRTHTVTLAKLSQTGIADGEYTFDVEFELPVGITTANIEIDGWNGALTFSAERKATANGVKVAMNGTVEMRGIPEGTIVRVKETNSEQFKVTSTVENMTPSQNLTTGEEASGYTTYGTVSGNGGRITYFNDVRDISLTGVTLRYAPYMAMIGAGLAVVGLSQSRRKEEEI